MKTLNPLTRRFWLAVFLALTGVEVLIALFVHDRFVRPYLGDVLVAVVVYALARTLRPRPPRWLPAGVFLFAAGVELLQLFQLAARLGLDRYPVLAIAMGSSFDPIDLVCYAVGSLACAVWQWAEGIR